MKTLEERIAELEAKVQGLTTAVLCLEARVQPDRVARGELTDREFRELAEAAARLSQCS